MPTELQIYRANEFIRIGAQGEFDLEASRAALAGLAKACQVRQINRGLLDVRDVKSDLSPAELAALVRTFEEIGFTAEHRLALLHRGDPEYRARTFALIGRMKGWQVQAFDSFEHAMVWLSEGDSPESETKPVAAIPVPVNVKPGGRENSG